LRIEPYGEEENNAPNSSSYTSSDGLAMLADQVLLMPLIGKIDNQGSGQAITMCLQGIDGTLKRPVQH
jgi:hypothetical protein